jgi:hypothetical protein
MLHLTWIGSLRPRLHPASRLSSRCEWQFGWQTRTMLPSARAMHGDCYADKPSSFAHSHGDAARACRSDCGNAALHEQPALGRLATLGPPSSTGTSRQGVNCTCCCTAIVGGCTPAPLVCFRLISSIIMCAMGHEHGSLCPALLMHSLMYRSL